MFNKHKSDTPPIYADLAIQVGNTYGIVDVEYPGWMDEVRRDLRKASRVGLVMRGERVPRLWMSVNGGPPEYFSRVIGTIDEQGDKRIRVAALRCGAVTVWLHRDGTVELADEPTVSFRRRL